jgi:hypothetical protein
MDAPHAPFWNAYVKTSMKDVIQGCERLAILEAVLLQLLVDPASGSCPDARG